MLCYVLVWHIAQYKKKKTIVTTKLINKLCPLMQTELNFELIKAPGYLYQI